MDKIKALIRVIKILIAGKFTGQIVLNFLKGDISNRIDKVNKESIELDDPLIPETWQRAIDADIASGKFSRSVKEVLEETLPYD